jgi:NAD dependent epimerase/dehydratase family enzyme
VLRLVLREESILALGSRRAIPSVAESIRYVFRWSDLDAALADVL